MAIKHMDNQLNHLPTEVRFCRKCVLSNQRPRPMPGFDANYFIRNVDAAPNV